MEYFPIMQSLQASNDLYEYVPNFFLFDVSFSLLIAANFLENITVVGIFHDETALENDELEFRKSNEN